MDGLDFRLAMLADPTFVAIPTVLVTGTRNISTAAEAMGVDAYIQKPVDLDRLVSIVGSLVQEAA